MEHKVFISYSSKDVEKALGVLEYLEGNGIKCWMAPRDITAGSHYASSILEAIKTTKAFLLIFSSNSDSSGQVLKEVDRAVDNNIPIIPFRIESHMPSEAMEYYLCNTHWLNAYDNIVEKYFDDLRISCQKIISENVEISTNEKNIAQNVVPDRLKNIVNQMKEDAIKEEIEGVEFQKKYEEEKKFLIEQEKKNKEREKQNELENIILLKRQKEERRLALLEKQKNKKITVAKKKSRKIEIIGFSIVAIAIIFLYIENKKVEHKFKNKIDFNEIKSKRTLKINNNDLRTRFFEESEFENISLNDLKLLQGTIESKEGDLFERVGHELVERKSNKYEIHNWLQVRKSQMNIRTSQNKSLKENHIVILNPLETGFIEKQWKLASNLQELVFSYYKNYVPLIKATPAIKDFMLLKKNNIVFTIKTNLNIKKKIKIFCSNKELFKKVNTFIELNNNIFSVSLNKDLKYSNEVVVELNSDNYLDLEVSKKLVRLVYKLNSK